MVEFTVRILFSRIGTSESFFLYSLLNPTYCIVYHKLLRKWKQYALSLQPVHNRWNASSEVNMNIAVQTFTQSFVSSDTVYLNTGL
jgi:hypothetical protein